MVGGNGKHEDKDDDKNYEIESLENDEHYSAVILIIDWEGFIYRVVRMCSISINYSLTLLKSNL